MGSPIELMKNRNRFSILQKVGVTIFLWLRLILLIVDMEIKDMEFQIMVQMGIYEKWMNLIPKQSEGERSFAILRLRL